MTTRLTLIKKDGCAPCAMLAANLDQAGIHYESINVSETPEAIEQYDITSVPVLIIEKVTRLHGMQSVETVKGLIN